MDSENAQKMTLNQRIRYRDLVTSTRILLLRSHFRRNVGGMSLTCFNCCARTSLCIHSSRGSCTNVCRTVCSTASFSLSTRIVVSQERRNAPSTPVTPKPFTIFRVNRNGTTFKFTQYASDTKTE